jgi:hypothetical protein
VAYPFDLRRIQSRAALIRALGIDDNSLDAVIAFDPPPRHGGADGPDSGVFAGAAAIFQRHDIPKRDRARGYRIAWEPVVLRNEYKALARRLDSFFRLALNGYPHDRAFGYYPGRNIRENAQAHAGHKHLLVLDITSFFPSISAERIEALFVGLGVEAEVAKLLSGFLTIGGALPLGLPTSPTLSNAILVPLDIELQAMAEARGVTYSRYADDLSFSSDGALPDIAVIQDYIERHGFALAEAKTRRSKIGQAHYVTGLSISDPVRPHVPRARKRALRQELYYAGKFGIDGHFAHLGIGGSQRVQEEVNRLDGLVKFVAHHEPPLAGRLKSDWAAALHAAGLRAAFAPKNQLRNPFHLFIDEAEYVRDGRKVLALGIAVTQHGGRIVTETREVLAATLEDLWAAGNVQAIEKKGMHFADATEDLRLDYVKRLEQMPFEGFVVYAACDDPADYQDTYLRLLRTLIFRRLKAAESRFATLYFEENDKVSREAVKACVREAHDTLRQSRDRHPLMIDVEFVSKPDMRISVPDFLLGVLGKYLQSKPVPEGKPESRDRLMFERLRDKLRVIVDLDQGEEYSRRHPIEPWTP